MYSMYCNYGTAKPFLVFYFDTLYALPTTLYCITPTTIMYSIPPYYFYSSQVCTLPLLRVYIIQYVPHTMLHTECVSPVRLPGTSIIPLAPLIFSAVAPSYQVPTRSHTVPVQEEPNRRHTVHTAYRSNTVMYCM